MGVVLGEGLDYKGQDPTSQVHQGRGSSKRCWEPSSHAPGRLGSLGGGGSWL